MMCESTYLLIIVHLLAIYAVASMGATVGLLVGCLCAAVKHRARSIGGQAKELLEKE